MVLKWWDFEKRMENLNNNDNNIETSEIIIVGAGIAGASLAAYLGSKGKKITVIERDMSEPDRIVGELLQPGGVHKLKELGLENCLENYDAQKVEGYAVHFQGKTLILKYPQPFGEIEYGRSFHHGKFVTSLRKAAIAQSTVQIIEGNVIKLIEQQNLVEGIIYKNKKGEKKEIRAPLTIVCDGCFSNLRRNLCDAQIQQKSRFVGLILKNIQLPVLLHGNVILANPSPILLYPISSNEIRILVDLPTNNNNKNSEDDNNDNNESFDIKQYLLNHVKNQLPDYLQSSFENEVIQGNIKQMPNRVLSANPIVKPGAVLIGDSLNMRHPLTGGGMTVALTDVVKLSKQLENLENLNDDNIDQITQIITDFYQNRNQQVATINILANALYDVFCESSADLREACFNYLTLGPNFHTGPITLLSGLSRKESTLLLHFFSVAIYGVVSTLKPYPTWSSIKKSYKMLKTAVNIIEPLTRCESSNRLLCWSCKALSYVFI
eukprot:TRINITY_DN895_c1_g1_i1.p1 TRINITY_DN895_c1_g1~~TRINITY_DN895_c1_g1_i1.p1  ORF type:complete len:493 (+),score=260.66 TRINITY_DN895_c1_g1_i1:48-1526(+)